MNQKNITKAIKHVSARKINERVLLDILMIKKPKNGKKVTLTKNNWRIIVEKFSGMKLSDIFDTKNGRIEPICDRFEKWKQNCHPVKFDGCDNAGKKK